MSKRSEALWLSHWNNPCPFSCWLQETGAKACLLILNACSYLGKRQGSAVFLVHFIGLDGQDNLFRVWIFLWHEVVPKFLGIFSVGKFRLSLAGIMGWREVFHRRGLSRCNPGSQVLVCVESCIGKNESGHFFLLFLLASRCCLWNWYKKAWYFQGLINIYWVLPYQLRRTLTFKQIFVQV